MTVLAATGIAVTRSGRALLTGISLQLGLGELVGIIGPNGAGKSTLLRCLSGLVVPDAGEVALGGRSLAAIPGRERGRSLGYVPQRFEPAWDYTVRDLLEMGASRTSASREALDEAAETHELTDLLDARWSRLSGGERARALLASVLVAKPPVLLADEPGASLDIRHRLDLLRRLRAYATGRAVALVLHELDLAFRFCDRVIVMDQGRIVLDGSARDVAASPVLDRVFGVTLRRLAWEEQDAAPLLVSTGDQAR